MKRSIRALLLAGSVLALAAAPTVPPVAAQTPTDLSLWVFVDRHGVFMVNQAERWNEANPDRPITVTYQNIPYEDMHNNLLAAFMSGQGAPDLVDIEIGKFSTFVKTEDNVHLLDQTDTVAPYLPDLIATRMAPYQAYGKQLGIDYHLGAFLMYYNKALLDEAGIDPDTIKTWDDYVAAGKAFQEHFPDKSWTAVGGTEYFTAAGLMQMNGGGLYNEAGELILNSPQNAEALQFMADMVNVHGIAIPTPGNVTGEAPFYTALQNGEIASVWMPQWYMTRFPDNMKSLCGTMIVRPMPIFQEGGFTTTMGGGTGTAVTDQTPAEEQQLAKEFLAFAKLTAEAQKALWTDLGFDPFRVDTYSDPELSQTDTPDVADWPAGNAADGTPAACFNGAVTFQQILAELDNVAPEYVGPLSPEARDYIEANVLNAVVSGGVPAADALAEAQTQVEAMG
jgi:arabinosaccharide transport system substrate-binding protein